VWAHRPLVIFMLILFPIECWRRV